MGWRLIFWVCWRIRRRDDEIYLSLTFHAICYRILWHWESDGVGLVWGIAYRGDYDYTCRFGKGGWLAVFDGLLSMHSVQISGESKLESS